MSPSRVPLPSGLFLVRFVFDRLLGVVTLRYIASFPTTRDTWSQRLRNRRRRRHHKTEEIRVQRDRRRKTNTQRKRRWSRRERHNHSDEQKMQSRIQANARTQRDNNSRGPSSCITQVGFCVLALDDLHGARRDNQIRPLRRSLDTMDT